MSNLIDFVADLAHACHDCGERGRPKEILSWHGTLKLLCHDEEKSCYNYVIMRAAA